MKETFINLDKGAFIEDVVESNSLTFTRRNLREFWSWWDFTAEGSTGKNSSKLAGKRIHDLEMGE